MGDAFDIDPVPAYYLNDDIRDHVLDRISDDM